MWSLDHWAILATLVLSSISDNRVFSLGTFSQVVLSIVFFINLSCNFSNLLAIWIFELLLSLSTSSTTVILLSEVTGNSWNCYISCRFMWSELLKNFSVTSRSLKKPYNTFHFYFFELNQKKSNTSNIPWQIFFWCVRFIPNSTLKIIIYHYFLVVLFCSHKWILGM